MNKKLNAAGLLTALLVISTINSCSVSAGGKRKAAAANTVTAKEQQMGWVSLFDGKTTNGWRPFGNKTIDSWSVEDGTLHCKAVAGGANERRGDLITVEQFENFELSIDWRIAPKGNSGILYMVSEKTTAPHLSGPEYQLIDDEGYPQKLEDWQKTGANYAMNPPMQLAARPAGEWNQTRILVNKGHVEHWLNGVKVVEYELWTDKWKAEKETGKWKDAPEYAASKQGHIALQDHGSEAWFRNIKIKNF
jgi:hypothetical protein